MLDSRGKIYIRHLRESVVSHILILLHELGNGFGLQILGVIGLNDGSKDILEETRRPNIVLGTWDMGETFLDNAHAQRQSSNLDIVSNSNPRQIRAHIPERKHLPHA